MPVSSFLFSGWEYVVRTLLIGVLAYIGLVFTLLGSGKRTLSKINAFDYIVTIAIGSALATVLLSPSTYLVQGLVAFAVLIGLQFAITWLSVRIRAIAQLVELEPTMLYYQGEFLTDMMKRERVTHSDVLQAVREKGIGCLDQVEAVVLETNGELSVIKTASRASGDHTSSLADVQGPGRRGHSA
jgi:uncharacterized membrane protein YcaP (DUF421 family)